MIVKLYKDFSKQLVWVSLEYDPIFMNSFSSSVGLTSLVTILHLSTSITLNNLEFQAFAHPSNLPSSTSKHEGGVIMWYQKLWFVFGHQEMSI